jgi:hypothetical protein
MTSYLAYLLLYIPVQLIAYLITPLLPLFAVRRMGWTDNHSYQSVEWRLPLLLSWFDTPDNSLLGDSRWMANHSGGYWSKVSWLYRNSLYGFKWSVLAAPANNKVCLIIEGPTKLDHHTKTYGTMRIKRGDGYWQYKCVKPLAWKLVVKRLRINIEIDTGRILILNMGWLLDDPSQEKALFMCSPRWKKA